jgi:hypothetical protein
MNARWRALHLHVRADVAVGSADNAGHFVLVLLAATVVRGWGGRVLSCGIWVCLRGRRPSRNLPDDASKALEGESSSGPFAARLARSIECTKSGIDSALVRLGAKFVSAGYSVRRGRVVDGSILTMSS